MVNHRVTGSPLEYILGWAEFYGNRIAVVPGVFVPRRRTEFLAQKAIDLSVPGIKVVDLCCGSGAVSVAISKAVDLISLYAVDIDPIAVQCAKCNVSKLGGLVYEGDLYNPLPPQLIGNVDIIVANAPYVPTEAIKSLPQEARLYEPKVALDGGKDGNDIHRKVAENASFWLASGGHLLIETSKIQAPQTVEIFTQSGLIAGLEYNNELDSTVVVGTKPSL
ncbi:methylase [Gottfriedia luciferensis]|uniref:peptide chain release factor N(5)-glutamine methyltransferase n=2 Tax=Gottfriedia luciferensis TaxID=178774 RepID=A0ABX2ZTC3_9BACI|nr:methylase [Gottfriedia luciferensis]